MAHLPKLSHHKRSGRGYVTDPFTRKEVYLGVFGSAECSAAYDAWIVQLIALRQEVQNGVPATGASRFTVAALVSDYLDHAEVYYRKHGKPTSELRTIKQVARVVNDLFGTLPADEFTPTRFKAVRAALVAKGLARKHVNKQMGRVRRIWRWGVEQEVVGPGTLQALEAIAELALGRTGVREEEPVEPVALEVVHRTIAVLDVQTVAMVRLQLHGAMRAEDVVVMRPCDITLTAESCLYVPWTHKTQHKGKERRLWLGPVCREVLKGLLASAQKPDAWLFPSKRRSRQGNSAMRGHLTVQTYWARIQRACERNKIPAWYPLQLRHLALTLVRERFGLDGAQIAGGHANAKVTEIYTARDEVLARKIAEEMG